MLKILATSDLHGYLPHIEEPFDILLIAGDICPPRDHFFSYQIEWMRSEFVPWIKTLPFRNKLSKVIMTWGNHDFVGERAKKSAIDEICRMTDNRLIVLKHEEYSFDTPSDNGIDELKIFGTPYCSEFGNWAFMPSDEKRKEKLDMIPEGIDILVSHDSPMKNGLGDITEGIYSPLVKGSRELAACIERVKPLLFVSGHFHSGNHKFEKIDNTWMANVSYVNERYSPVNPILSMDYDENKHDIVEHDFIFCDARESF